MVEFTGAELARFESIAQQLVISQIESTRDLSVSTDFGAHALTELLGGKHKDPERFIAEILQVIWFLSFFAAAGAVTEEAKGGVGSGEELQQHCDGAIKEIRRRLAYLATVQT